MTKLQVEQAKLLKQLTKAAKKRFPSALRVSYHYNIYPDHGISHNVHMWDEEGITDSIYLSGDACTPKQMVQQIKYGKAQ